MPEVTPFSSNIHLFAAVVSCEQPKQKHLPVRSLSPFLSKSIFPLVKPLWAIKPFPFNNPASKTPQNYRNC
jgi:hypothetical protein